jgi:cytoskeletal protein CcmA (bactofilin family)
LPPPTTTPAESSGATTVIGEKIVVDATITGGEDTIEVRGVVRGRIETKGHLLVAKGARVEADVSVRTIQVDGYFECAVVMADMVTISPGGELVGDVRSPRVLLADGGRLRGAVDTVSEREELIDQVLATLGSPSPTPLQLFAEPKWSKHRGGL